MPKIATPRYQCSVCKKVYYRKSAAMTCEARPIENRDFKVGDFVSVIETRHCYGGVGGKYKITKGKIITLKLVPADSDYEIRWLGGKSHRLQSHVYQYEVEYPCPICQTTKRIICYTPEIKLA